MRRRWIAVAFALTTVGALAALAQTPRVSPLTMDRFFARVGGEAAAAGMIKEAVTAVADNLPEASILVLETGESQPDGMFPNWWSKTWIPDFLPLPRLTGEAARKHVNSCGRFLRLQFYLLEPETNDRVMIGIVNGTVCSADGPTVTFNRDGERWRRLVNGFEPGAGMVRTHCSCP